MNGRPTYTTPAEIVAALRTTANDAQGANTGALLHSAADMIEVMAGLRQSSAQAAEGITIIAYPSDKKIHIIRTIRAAMGLDLMQAKAASERLPFTIAFLSSHNGYTWDAVASDLRHYGAEITVRT